MVIFRANALGDELRLVEQRPETIRVAGEVMPDRLRPLAGIDADKQHAHARLDAIAEHARILYVAVREPPEGKGGCDDAHADEDRQIARRVTLPQQDGRAMIVMERRRPPYDSPCARSDSSSRSRGARSRSAERAARTSLVSDSGSEVR